MNSTFEQKNTRPSMAEMKAMQQTALSRNIDKAGNLQKAVTLTEENWTGLTGAVALTGESMLRLEERVGHLLTGEQMDAMLKEQMGAMFCEPGYWAYMEANYYADDYYSKIYDSLEPTEEQILAYFDAHASELSFD